MNELKVRVLTENDWETLCSWWLEWPDWKVHPSKEMLPLNGLGGFMVENNDVPIVAGFLYLTNSNIAWLEWIISDPNYKGINKKQAIELLITSAENAARNQGKEVIFSVSRNKTLLKMHKELGYTIDKDPSYEITKNIKN